MSLCPGQSPECPDSSPAAISHTYNSVRSQKRLGLVHGMPCYSPIQEFTDAGLPACTYQYSNNGRLFVYAFPSSVRISQAENATPMQELNIVELNFSPRGTYIFTWECPVELEDSTTLQVYGFLALSPTPSSAKTFFKADCSQMERPRQPGTHHHSDCSRQCQHERLRFTFSVRPITLIVGLHWTRMGPFTTLHGVQTVKGLVGHTDAATMPWSWSRNVRATLIGNTPRIARSLHDSASSPGTPVLRYGPETEVHIVEHFNLDSGLDTVIVSTPATEDELRE